MWPSVAAMCSGVSPPMFFAFKSAPAPMSRSTAGSRPAFTAQWSAVKSWPSLCAHESAGSPRTASGQRAMAVIYTHSAVARYRRSRSPSVSTHRRRKRTSPWRAASKMVPSAMARWRRRSEAHAPLSVASIQSSPCLRLQADEVCVCVCGCSKRLLVRPPAAGSSNGRLRLRSRRCSRRLGSANDVMWHAGRCTRDAATGGWCGARRGPDSRAPTNARVRRHAPAGRRSSGPSVHRSNGVDAVGGTGARAFNVFTGGAGGEWVRAHNGAFVQTRLARHVDGRQRPPSEVGALSRTNTKTNRDERRTTTTLRSKPPGQSARPPNPTGRAAGGAYEFQLLSTISRTLR